MSLPPEDARIHYEVENAGLRLSTPVDWSSGVGLDGDVVVFTAPHPDDTPFQSNLTVVTRPREAGEELPDDLPGEQARALLVLDDALLLESEEALVGGRPAAHALVAYDSGEYDLTLEQWVVPAPDRVVVISATVLTFDYAHDADLYEDIVLSVVFDG
jgi:hypothetical protein